ncbi:MAG: pyrimidine 5'-nucleotidase [Alphaproteobacteria bacterium]|nr:pyrimidine 5'-nucleotidase [Alphaproteobacteria bacterium]
MPVISPSFPAEKSPAENLARRAAWVFDLDNTLYPARCDLFAQVDVRIRDYVSRYLGLGADAAWRLQKDYFRDHGTTLRGMMHHHGMDPGPYLAYVHDIDLAAVRPDPLLAAALAGLPGRKIVFTNASAAHAERVMDRLGVARHFEAVFDIVAADYLPKPEPAVYDALVRRLNLVPAETVMVEDIPRNLAPAARMGMTTVLVRTDGKYAPPVLAKDGAVAADSADPAAHIHHVVEDLGPWLASVAGIRA